MDLGLKYKKTSLNSVIAKSSFKKGQEILTLFPNDKCNKPMERHSTSPFMTKIQVQARVSKNRKRSGGGWEHTQECSEFTSGSVL